MCRWCDSKQVFNDETDECRGCYSLRQAIEHSGYKVACNMIEELTTSYIASSAGKCDTRINRAT